MKIDRTLKIGVVSSLVASAIFLLLLQPLFGAVGHFLFGSGQKLFHAYTDRLIKESALLSPPDSGYLLLIAFLLLSAGASVGYTSGRITSSWTNGQGSTESIASLKEKLRRLHRFPWGVLFVVLAIVSVTLCLLYAISFEISVVTSFKQHMTAIAPYTTDQQLKQLYSRWTQMRTAEDYDRIYAELRQIASTNHVVLPANLMFPIPLTLTVPEK